jgi:hypothetical protein
MQALIQQAQAFSAAISYLAKIAIAAKHAPKAIYEDMLDPEQMAEAYKDAKIAAIELHEMGQAQIISCMMEAIEAATWQLSPSSDYEDHLAILHDIFQEMMELELEDEAEDASEDASEEGSIAWQKSMLENCLAASAG